MPLFVLASVARGGLRSLYTLQKGVGLQPGAIHPVLRRLEEDGLLHRSPQGRRRRRLMTVTPKGDQFLIERWRDCLCLHPDVESVLRATTVAILMRDLRSAVAYLHEAAHEYVRAGGRTVDTPKSPSSGIDWYEFMHDSWEEARRQCAARVFREIAGYLEHQEEACTSDV